METTTTQYVDFRFEQEVQKEIAERMNITYIYNNGESN